MLDSKIAAEAARFYNFLVRFGREDGWEYGEEFYKELVYFIVRERSVVAAPRGSGKTSIYSRWWVLYNLLEIQGDVLENKCIGVMVQDVEAMLVSESEKLALEHVSWIRGMLEKSRDLRSVYGDKVPKTTDSHVWSRDRLELLNGAKVYGLGSSAQIRGYHPTIIVCDDLESLKNMDTPEKLRGLMDWFNRSLMGCVMPTTKVAVAGTVIARESLLNTLRASPIWHGRKFKALNQRVKIGEDGKEKVEEYSLIPSRWPLEWLYQRRKELGEWAFESEYQNAPRPSTDPVIRKEWIRRYNGDVPVENGQMVQWYIGVDPAVTEERSGCDSAVVVFSRTENHVLWERMVWRGKVSGPNLIRRIIEIYYMVCKWACGTPVSLGIEEAAQQKFVRQAIGEIDASIIVQPLKPLADKVTRLMDVSRHFESGRVVMKTDWLIEDLCSAPYCRMDAVDACVFAIKLCERDLPEFNLAGASCELIRGWDKVGDIELELYSGLAETMGDAIIRMPAELLKRRLEAKRLEEQMQDFIW
jgi:hypothetical protein